MSQKQWHNILLVLGLVLLTVPLWLKVDLLTIRLWDEARNAVNALEMLSSGDLITRTFNYIPETYNLKPPFLTWLQVISFKLFGINELAVRMPSVIASISTIILVCFWVYKETNSRVSAFFAAGITATSSGFYGDHVSRFGDHDALLVFFCTALVFLVVQYVKTKKNEYLYLSSLTLILGVLTKSISILMFGPGLLLYVLFSQNLVGLFRNNAFYLSLFGFVFSIGAYYLVREHSQPGFLSFVWNDELFPRYFNTSENLTFAEPDKFYYINLFYTKQFKYFFFLLPLALIVPFIKKMNRLDGFWAALFVTLFFVAVISRGTNNFWYGAPAIPIMAVLAARISDVILNAIKTPTWITIVLVAAALFYPYKTAYTQALQTQEKAYDIETYGVSYYLEERGHNLSSNHKILLDSIYGFEPHMFYNRRLELEKGVFLNRIWQDKVRVGDTLLISHISTYNYLNTEYKTETIDSLNDYTKLVFIYKKRESEALP